MAEQERKFNVGDVVRGKSTRKLKTLTERVPEFDGMFGEAWRYEEDPFDWIGSEQWELVEKAKGDDDMVKFSVGDRVHFSCTAGSGTGVIESAYDVGYFIKSDGERNYGRSDGLYWAWSHNMELIGNQPKFSAGDKVRGILTGQVYTLKERDPMFDDQGNGIAWRHDLDPGWIGEDQVELIEEKPEQPELNVGDHAIIAKWTNQLHGFDVGDEVEIVRTDAGPGHPIAVSKVGGSFVVGYTEFEYLKPAQPKKRYVKMLEHDDNGYNYGDILEVTEDGRYFIDNDGDKRILSLNDHVEVMPGQAKSDEITRKDVVDFLRTKDADELLDIIEEARD